MKHFLWSRVRVYYKTDKKYKKCFGKLSFKGQPQADSFLVELILILLSHIGQGDVNRVICYDFNFKSKPLELNHKKTVIA